MKLSDLDSVIDFFAENDTYIDTNAVMNYGFETLMRNCSLKLKEKGAKIFICHSVMNELKKLVNTYSGILFSHKKKEILSFVTLGVYC